MSDELQQAEQQADHAGAILFQLCQQVLVCRHGRLY
jgi:hypothetical protein